MFEKRKLRRRRKRITQEDLPILLSSFKATGSVVEALADATLVTPLMPEMELIPGQPPKSFYVALQTRFVEALRQYEVAEEGSEGSQALEMEPASPGGEGEQ